MVKAGCLQIRAGLLLTLLLMLQGFAQDVYAQPLTASIVTDKGTMEVELNEQAAPTTVAPHDVPRAPRATPTTGVGTCISSA